VAAPKGTAVGTKLSLVIRGEMQTGKETFVRVAPAGPIQVVAPPQVAPPQEGAAEKK
jgi:hypothetical protein